MLAKERASGACHMCQCSGCAAGAGTAHGVQPSIAMILGFGLCLGFNASLKLRMWGKHLLVSYLNQTPFSSVLVVHFGCSLLRRGNVTTKTNYQRW